MPPFLVFGTMIISSAALLNALKLKTRWHWAMYTLSLTAGFYSHSVFFLLAVFQGLWVLIRHKRLGKPAFLSPYIASIQFSLAVFMPRLSVLLHQIEAPLSPWVGAVTRLCFVCIAVNLWLNPSESSLSVKAIG